MDNNHNKQSNKNLDSMSLADKLAAADKAKEDARNQYQAEDNFKKNRAASEKEKLDIYKNQGNKEKNSRNDEGDKGNSSNNNSNLNRPTSPRNTPAPTPQAPLSKKQNHSSDAKRSSQSTEQEEERLRRQRESSTHSRRNNFKRHNKENEVNLNMVVPPMARRMDPPTRNVPTSNSKRNQFFNKLEIENIKTQVRQYSSPKPTIKQALGRSIKKVKNTTISQGKDMLSAAGSEYAGAEYAKQQVKNVGIKAATNVGLGGVLNAKDKLQEGVGLLTSEDSAKAMYDISSKIATKGIKNIVNIDKNAKAKAEKLIRKKSQKLDKLDRKYEKINRKELKLREKADKNYTKKHTARGDKLNSKANKLRDKRASKNNKLGIKRNKETIRINKLKAKAKKKIQRAKIMKKLLLKIFAPAMAVVVMISCLSSSIVGSGASVGGYLATKFVSSICDFLSLDWTSTGKELAMLENMNWAQYIADDTAISLGGTFVDAAKKDAQQHYMDRKVTLSEVLNSMGNKDYPRYDWYCDLGEGSIGSIWMREQSDCITDVEGKVIYGADGTIDGDENKSSKDFDASDLLYVSGGRIDTMSGNYGYDMKYVYEEDDSNRLTITPNANIVPILSLAHDRYTDEWTWENYEVVEAYVWYMYTLSHNSAHYDDNAGDDTGTYNYDTQQMCDKSIFYSDSYLDAFNYDSSSSRLTRPTSTLTYDENGVLKSVLTGTSCTNVYVHGYTKGSIFGNDAFKNQVKEKAKSVAKKVISWIDVLIEASSGIESDLASLVKSAGTYTISYPRSSTSGYQTYGTYSVSNGSETRTVDSIYNAKQILGGVKDGNGNTIYCDNIQYRQLSDDTVCGKAVHKHKTTLDAGTNNCICSKEIHVHGSGCNYDHEEHTHTSGCSYTKCGKTEHNHTSGCSYTKCGKTEHSHSDSCELTCEKEEHKEHTSACKTITKTLVCTHSHGSGCWDASTRTYNCSHGATHSSSCYQNVEIITCGKEIHEHTDDCCPIEAHKHTGNECCSVEVHTHTGTECCAIDYHAHNDDCCTKDEHPEHNSSCCTIEHTEHRPWVSETNPGCYDTFAYCAGHCGGHIKPSVNLSITYTMEGLSYQDAVSLGAGSSSGKDSSWTGNTDMRNLIDDLNNVPNLREWAKITNKQCAKWFKAGPNGPVSALCYIGESLHDVRLIVFRGWRDFWKSVAEEGFIDAIFGAGSDTPTYNDASKDQELENLSEDEGEDAYQFEGWFEGSGTNISFNKQLFDELHGLYGDPDDFYQDGLEIWDGFDVQFRVGFGNVLTNEEISKIQETIKNRYLSSDTESNQKRLSIIADALKSCGFYNYNSSEEAHYNGMYSNMGTSDSLGFVSGVYMRTLGSECGFWNDVSNEYTSPGTGEVGTIYTKGEGGISAQLDSSIPSSSKRVGGINLYHISYAKPGDILLDKTNGYGCVYLGYYTDPNDGTTGYWVVDCIDSSADSKTSSYRVLNSSEISSYNLLYRPTTLN